MTYRTKTYLAGDWTGDENLISKIQEWNDSDYWQLCFTDAHEMTQANDSSLACSIKKSLRERLKASKTFVLIVGKNTTALRKGSCSYCTNYNSYRGMCKSQMNVDYRSFINYECEMAIKYEMKIVVIYNYLNVDKSKCPHVIKSYGKHINGYYCGKDGKNYWNYQEIKKAIMD